MKKILILIFLFAAFSCRKNDSITNSPVKKKYMYRVIQHNKDGTIKISPVMR